MLACENLSPVSVGKLLNESFTPQVDVSLAGSFPGVSAASGKLWDVDLGWARQSGDNQRLHVLLPLLAVSFEKFVQSFVIDNAHVSEHSSKNLVKILRAN